MQIRNTSNAIQVIGNIQIPPGEIGDIPQYILDHPLITLMVDQGILEVIGRSTGFSLPTAPAKPRLVTFGEPESDDSLGAVFGPLEVPLQIEPKKKGRPPKNKAVS